MIPLAAFGVTSITSTVETGAFFCPRCQSRQRYRRRVVRRFLTFYFIPLLPMEVEKDFIECASCSEVLDRAALSYNPDTARAQFFQHLKRIMVLAMIADGTVSEAEIAAIESVYREYSGQDLTREEIIDEIARASQFETTVADYASRIEPQLGQGAKEMVVKAVFLIATAAGDLLEPQKEQIKQLQHSLRISETALRKYIAEAAEGE